MTDTTADLVAALERAEAELLECAEYFDQRADVDGDSEGCRPNREMIMRQGVSEALERIDAALARAKGGGEASSTDGLVDRFAEALKQKLRAAEAKYGYSDAWTRDDWAGNLRRDLLSHVWKGDPRDVAAYCAFAWHHGWSVAPEEQDDPIKEAYDRGWSEALARAKGGEGVVDHAFAEALYADQHGPSAWSRLTNEGRAYYVQRYAAAYERAQMNRLAALQEPGQ